MLYESATMHTYIPSTPPEAAADAACCALSMTKAPQS